MNNANEEDNSINKEVEINIRYINILANILDFDNNYSNTNTTLLIYN